MIKNCRFEVIIGDNTKEVEPHYKELKVKYSKEANQAFFRNSLDGKVILWGEDCDFVRAASFERTCIFNVYSIKTGALLSTNQFNKVDCKFDNFKHSVEIKLTPNDDYTKILDAYENTYDLIKLAPEITKLQVTKRAFTQLYIQGSKVVTNILGSTYWETEVESVTDDDELQRKYHFAKGPIFKEIVLDGFNYAALNTTFKCIASSNIWNADINVAGGTLKASIVFVKTHDKHKNVNLTSDDIRLLSADIVGGFEPTTNTDDEVYTYYDLYKIRIYDNANGTGNMLYESKYYYAKDTDFTLAQGDSKYAMNKATLAAPLLDPSPASFYLGANVIEYAVYARIICNVAMGADGTETYDIDYDDFAVDRQNYKKCIGATLPEGGSSIFSVLDIYHVQRSTTTPLAYGVNDYDEYFMPPASLAGEHFIPVARSEWANTSIWALTKTYPVNYEDKMANFYETYTLKDTYSLAAAIKAVIQEIDPTITHEMTAEYSNWLYGTAAQGINGNCFPYITQKTNVLKGNYDQAAQKAEVTLKQLMEMLRNCFRCYWFIDDQHRLRIEHASYFMKGLRYQSNVVDLDLTTIYDKFNNKVVIYDQEEVEYDKTELAGRYELDWSDTSTELFGSFAADIKNNYVQKDKTESITIDKFVSDIDLMLLIPTEFSSEGFALLMANSNKVVPVVNSPEYKDTKQFNTRFTQAVNNFYASIPSLFFNYLLDLSGNLVEDNITNSWYTPAGRIGIKQFVKHKVVIQQEAIPNVYGLVKTSQGNGSIESMTYDIDRNIVNLDLRYSI